MECSNHLLDQKKNSTSDFFLFPSKRKPSESQSVSAGSLQNYLTFAYTGRKMRQHAAVYLLLLVTGSIFLQFPFHPPREKSLNNTKIKSDSHKFTSKHHMHTVLALGVSHIGSCQGLQLLWGVRIIAIDWHFLFKIKDVFLIKLLSLLHNIL